MLLPQNIYIVEFVLAIFISKHLTLGSFNVEELDDFKINGEVSNCLLVMIFSACL